MQPLRVGIAGRVALFAGLGLVGVIVAERPMQAAGQAQPLLQPTPLVLKDGRIASVSIHKVPFAPGRGDVGAEARAGLAELTRAVGTDCFLTAQVIGHIDSSEVAEDDTLTAHRLARSRADAVQASLIERGLPAKAIASVWDWQFMVREARATLWIFQLTAGEDCEGRPLREDMVAQAPGSNGQPRVPEPARKAALAAAAPAQPMATPAQQAAEPPQPAAPERQRQAIVPALAPTEAAPKRETAEAQIEPHDSQPLGPESDRKPADTGVPSVTQPLPASTPAPALAAKPAKQAVVAAARDQPPSDARKTATDAKVEADPQGRLVITFATNSSYFPPGARNQLNRLLSDVSSEKRYEVFVQVAVSGTTKVVGAKSPAEAAKYNRWLAERRLERVQQWLLEHTNPDTVSIKPEYLEDDESRRVVVRVAPVG
jgi:outer membrane protein OmpA-like peptidoglycan-associated protein